MQIEITVFVSLSGCSVTMVTPPDSSGPSTGPSTDPSTLGSSPDTQPLGSQTAEEEEEEVNHDGPIPWGRLMIRTSLNRTDSVTIEGKLGSY